MTIHHHPDDATLMSYASGNLPEALSAVIASHVAMCEICKKKVLQYESLGGAFLSLAPEAPLASGSLDAIMQRFDEIYGADQNQNTTSRKMSVSLSREDQSFASAQTLSRTDDVLPAPLCSYLRMTGADIPWRFMAPGIKTFRIPLSKKATGDLRLLKIKPGCTLPEHSHGGLELTLVLKGSYSDKFGTFARGDLADLHDDDVDHQPIVDEGQECICLVASEKKANFKSFMPRLLQPFIGM